MSLDITSWFYEQLLERASKPERLFLIGTSDYSERVTTWPKLKRSSKDVQALSISVPLANTDGGLNHFYENPYKLKDTCYLKLGFTHPTSGQETATIFTGNLKNVVYNNQNCTLKIKDRLWDFTQKKVGDSDVPCSLSSQIPSDIAWTLCTCYGGLSGVQDTSNPDIDYESFQFWAAQFSADSILMQAYYDGIKVSEALTNLAKISDSAIWIEGDGKLNFRRFIESDSLDMTFTRDEFFNLLIKVESLRVVNKQTVYWDYSVESDYWQKTVNAVDSTSVNTFGAIEEIIKDETIWHTDSVSALNLAQRKVNLFNQPPRRFELKTALPGFHKQLGETIRLVDDFYGITSASGWRLTEYSFDMERGHTIFEMDEATVQNAFYLDVSNLDGDESLL